MPKSKVTVDLSELKGKLGKIRSELSKEKVGEHIVDAIVDNIRNNSINPKTGKPYGLPAVTKMMQDAVKGIVTTEGSRPAVKSDTRSNAVLKLSMRLKLLKQNIKFLKIEARN